MTVTIYGIKNCGSMKKAFAWLDEHGIAYDFHDYKKVGIDEQLLVQWCADVGFETLLNKKGTTFRKLSDDDKADIDQAKAVSLMVANPSMIKRPVIDQGGALLVGYDETALEAAFV